MFAVEDGSYSLLMTVLDFGADPNEQVADYMDPPLGAAVRLKQADKVRLLLERGADPNQQLSDGTAMDTPLSSAIKLRQADMVRLLLEHGADPNAQIGGGPSTDSALSIAVIMKEADIVRLLLERGADPNIGQPHYLLPKEAVMRGSLGIARQLLSAGANAGGDIPTLHDAVWWNSVELTRLLLQMGADINLRDRNGETPLHFGQTLEICEFLIDNGADLNIRDNDGRTPIFSFDYAKVQLLLRRGADANTKDNNGRTPLMWVVRRHEGYIRCGNLMVNSFLPLIQLLLDNGANADGCRNIPALLPEMRRRRQPGRF